MSGQQPLHTREYIAWQTLNGPVGKWLIAAITGSVFAANDYGLLGFIIAIAGFALAEGMTSMGSIQGWFQKNFPGFQNWASKQFPRATALARKTFPKTGNLISEVLKNTAWIVAYVAITALMFAVKVSLAKIIGISMATYALYWIWDKTQNTTAAEEKVVYTEAASTTKTEDSPTAPTKETVNETSAKEDKTPTAESEISYP